MPRALNAASYVYQGAWTNWNKGASLGLTVTLSLQNAAILVAALALFISMVGSQLWDIIRFLLHQYRATAAPKPGIYHQQQAITRNSGSSISFLVSISLVTARWRHRTGRSLGSFLLLSLSALAHLSVFTILGVLSSKLVKTGDEVLIRSPFCLANNLPDAYYNFNNQTQYYAAQLLTNADLLASIEYARSCYNTTSPPEATCGSFPTPSIKFNTTTNVPCPFDASVCHPGASAVRFDTGFIESLTGFGMNSRSQDRVYARKITTCMPLNDAKYVRVNNDSSLNKLNVADALYGPQIGFLENTATYSTTNVSWDMTADQRANVRPYQLAIQFARQPGKTQNATAQETFDPIKELAHADGDLNLVFMTFDGFYRTPIDDPWFSSHVKYRSNFATSSDSVNVTIFAKDAPISTMACNEQYQFCAGGTSNCTATKSLIQVAEEIVQWPLTEYQSQSLAWIITLFNKAGLNGVLIQNGGDAPLLANDLVYGGNSPSIPDYQWRLEAEYWFSISLAYLQRSMINQATGQAASDTSWVNTTMTTVQKQFCDNLFFRGTDYQSFSLFALIMILVVGLVIVFLSFCIENLTGYIQKRYNRGLARKDMWEANHVLQLQRMLYEAHGEGVWSGQGNSIPITKSGELLPTIKVHDDNNSNDQASRARASSSSHMISTNYDPEKLEPSTETSLMPAGEHNDSDTSSTPTLQTPAQKRVERKPLPPNSSIYL